jgi:hypothetical protein
VVRTAVRHQPSISVFGGPSVTYEKNAARFWVPLGNCRFDAFKFASGAFREPFHSFFQPPCASLYISRSPGFFWLTTFRGTRLPFRPSVRCSLTWTRPYARDFCACCEYVPAVNTRSNRTQPPVPYAGAPVGSPAVQPILRILRLHIRLRRRARRRRDGHANPDHQGRNHERP